MNNSQHHNIIVGKEFIFGKNGQWKIKNNQVNFISSYYHIPIILYELKDGVKWIEIGSLDLKFRKNDIQEYQRIENTYLEFRINNMTITNLGKMIFGLEINEIINKELQCYFCLSDKNPISFTYIYGKKRKSFCSKQCLYLDGRKRKYEEIDEDEDEDKPQQKKIRIDTSIKELDILMIGEDHGIREEILHGNLKDCLTEFSLQFNSIKINKHKRKPFLIFWETLTREDQEKSINLSEINGRETQSWTLPLDPAIMGSFSFMQSAYVAFLYPVVYELDGTPDNDENAKIQLSIGYSHGYHEKIINIERDGFESPIAIWLSWNFIEMVLKYILINGINNTDFLHIFLPDTNIIKSFIDDLRQIWISVVNYNKKIVREKVIKKVYENLSEIVFDSIDSLKEQAEILINEILPKDSKLLFTKESHRTLLELIYVEDDISYKNLLVDLKIFIIKYWLKFAALVDANKVEYPFNLNYSINLNYTRIFDPIIDEKFFQKLIEELNLSLSIDLPTLLYTMFMKSLMKNKKIDPKSDKDIIVKTRDFVSAQTIIDICNFKKIKRCIILHGTYHTESLSNIFEIDGMQKDNNGIQHKIMAYDMHDINLKKIKYDESDDEDIKEGLIKLILFVMLEKIDQWLWDTENKKGYKRKVTLYNGDDDLKKLQYHSYLSEHFLEMPESSLKKYISYILMTNNIIYAKKGILDYEKTQEEIITENGIEMQFNRKIGYLFKLDIRSGEKNTDSQFTKFTDITDFIDFIDLLMNLSNPDMKTIIIS